MKRRFEQISFTLLLVTVSLLFSTCKREFESPVNSSSALKFLYNDYYDKVAKISPTADGGFIYCGSKLSDNENRDAFMFKVDAQGNKEWYRTYGGKYMDHLFDVKQTADGGYIAVGYTNSIGKAQWDTTRNYQDYVLRTDGSGNLRWERSYNELDGSDFSRAYGVAEDVNHDFYLTGVISFNTSNYFYTRKIRDNGNIVMNPIPNNDTSGMDFDINNQKNRPYFFVGYNLYQLSPTTVHSDWYNVSGVSLTMLANGQFLVGGLMGLSTKPTGANRLLNFMAKFTPNGGMAFIQPYYDYVRWWQSYSFSEPKRIMPQVTKELPDGFLLATYFEEEGSVLSMQLIKTDLNGNLLWEKKYKGLGYALLFDVHINPDGTMLLVGASSKEKLNASYPEYFQSLKATIIKVDASGNEIWTSYVGGDLNVSIARCVQPNSEGGYTIGAYSSSAETGYDRPFTYKISSTGKFMEK